MISLKYTKWKDISINVYRDIQNIYESDLDDMSKEVSVLSLLCGCDEEEIWNLKITEINELRSGLSFLGEVERDDKDFKKIMVGDEECYVIADLNKFSYAQYVDFQTFFPEHDNLAKLLSTIIIPEGKKYNDGYDIVEFIQKIGDNLDIVTATSISFFFLRRFLSSMKRMNLYLQARLTVMKMMTKKNNPKYKEIKSALENSKRLQRMLTSVLSRK